MVCPHKGGDPQTCHGMQRRFGEIGEAATKDITVINKEFTFLIGLGTWVFQECIQIFKTTFLSSNIQKQEEKYVLRYFSTLFPSFPMLIIEDKGNNQKEKKPKLGNIKPKS